jgi:hypothetical protein
MSLLKMNGTRYTVHFYDFYGFGEMGDITQLPVRDPQGWLPPR